MTVLQIMLVIVVCVAIVPCAVALLAAAGRLRWARVKLRMEIAAMTLAREKAEEIAADYRRLAEHIRAEPDLSIVETVALVAALRARGGTNGAVIVLCFCSSPVAPGKPGIATDVYWSENVTDVPWMLEQGAKMLRAKGVQGGNLP